VSGYWLIKSEPTVYPWSQLQKEKRTVWDGIRSFEARNNLRAMKVGDLCAFYHSNVGKEIVGVARVVREAYADPKAPDEDWSAIDIAPEYPLEQAVTLATLKSTKSTAAMELVKKSRLSVTRVTAAEWKAIHTLAQVTGSASDRLLTKKKTTKKTTTKKKTTKKKTQKKD
jgi:predicted RNA-binding protein with PUA-like domain